MTDNTRIEQENIQSRYKILCDFYRESNIQILILNIYSWSIL